MLEGSDVPDEELSSHGDELSPDSPDSIEIITAEDAAEPAQIPAQMPSEEQYQEQYQEQRGTEREDQEIRTKPAGSDELTDHVSNVLDGKQLEEAKKAVGDLTVICRALRVILVMQCSILWQFLWRLLIKHTNNDQLRPVRVLVKKQYGILTKHYSAHLKPLVKTHGKLLWGVGYVISTWAVFYVLYVSLFNFDYFELSYMGVSDATPVYGPFYKRHVALKERKSLTDLAMKKHRFNSFKSDQTPLNREIPDTRSEGCADLMYPHNLPVASVIIVFHNEALTVLLRTVHSVLDKTPPHLLKEILLVDDFSDAGELKTLDYELSKLIKTSHVRLPKRSGLIKARLFGAARATGEVMIFLDSHCECNSGWVEPLLYEVKKDKTTVPSPIIDVIMFDTFEYRQANPQVGAFDWSFTFYWQQVEQKNFTEPLIAPVMAGGLFAIDRSYFEEIGTYDTDMNIWGGENMEMSFRIWMCGGRLLSMPCSRVGHIFRDRAPYSFGGESQILTLYRNYARAVEVWLDGHKDLFYRFVPLAKDLDIGDISSRVNLRKRLNCKSFDWYLENLLPMLPTEKKLLASGQIRNNKIGQCVDTLGKRKANDTVSHYRCLPKREPGYTNQVWMYSKKYEVISLENCLDASIPDANAKTLKRVSLWPCHGLGGNQKWHYSSTQQIIHAESQLCLSVGDPSKPKLFLDKCDGSARQIFSFTNIYSQDDFDF
ncbi:polypeptide N-acetylgalactosaminyltransferase 1-like [Bolinopsis microptera]|uniref:polypeptide N-acetylgalactosaminyltransferase 1-like n=1 Tax=Bolinopsis microptera TaxID=2820187 RepID=UPI003079E414